MWRDGLQRAGRMAVRLACRHMMIWMGSYAKEQTEGLSGRKYRYQGGQTAGGPELTRVIDLVDAGLVTVLTTDLTVTEVAKKHVQNDFDLIKDICQPHFRKVNETTTGTAIPKTKRA